MALKIYKDPEDFGAAITISGEKSLNHFKLLVNRAMNCWDNAPPELKEFADILEYGKPLQDYYSMDQPMNTKPEPVKVLSESEVEALLPCEECGRPGFGHLFSCPKFGKTKK